MNKIIKKKNYALVILCRKDGSIRAKAKIDLEDVNKVIKFQWCAKKARGKFRVACTSAGVFIHNIIMNGKFIDHINRNPLDNRKKNLRFADATLQNFNKGLQKNNKSGYRGVYLRSRIINNKNYKYWIVTFKKNHMGQFKTKDEAIKFRVQIEKEYGTI